MVGSYIISLYHMYTSLHIVLANSLEASYYQGEPSKVYAKLSLAVLFFSDINTGRIYNRISLTVVPGESSFLLEKDTAVIIRRSRRELLNNLERQVRRW